MTKSRGINRPKHFWTADQVATLTLLYPDTKAQIIADELCIDVGRVYKKAKALGLKKSEAFLSGPESGRLDGIIGAATRFQAGNVSFNKGKHFHAGGRSIETQFKKREPQECSNYLPIGTLRVKLGYLCRKYTDDRRLAPARRWSFVHRDVWVAANGPVPDGYIVAFKPGHKTVIETDITVEKLELVSRADFIKRHSIHTFPGELADLMRLRGAITRQINKKEKTNDQR